MNSVRIAIMLCATFRNIPFQLSSSYNSMNCPQKRFKALTFSIAYSNAKCISTKWQHRQWRCLAERVSFSGSRSKCLMFNPLPCAILPSNLHWCMISSSILVDLCNVSTTGTKFMQLEVWLVCTLTEQAHASRPCLSTTHKPLKTNT
jgi:hypothetical protein